MVEDASNFIRSGAKYFAMDIHCHIKKELISYGTGISDSIIPATTLPSFFRQWRYGKGLVVCLLPLLLLAGCGSPIIPGSDATLTFAVIDVGQGLAQIILQKNRALLFDTGPPDSIKNWKQVYRLMGSPHLEAVIISHRDLDHAGGLRFLDTSVDWSGRLITGKWEDTARIRSYCSNWDGPIVISTIADGDSIFFTEECAIDCRWPPEVAPDTVPVPDESVNYYSLVTSIRHRYAGILFTGDIDSIAARTIARNHQTELRADIIVVPHHGSASSNSSLLYGYVKPATAVISAGENNSYGHPSPITTEMLADHGITCLNTAIDGSIFRSTSGYYWETGMK